MASPELFILDVGHGNTAVLLTTRRVAIFDAAPGPTLIEFLAEREIKEIDLVLISHADADHVGGLVSLLSSRDLAVQDIMLNPDAVKGTDIWDDVRSSLQDAHARGAARLRTALNESTSIENIGDGITIEVLAPAVGLALSGPGGHDLNGRPLTSNSMSAVVRITTSQGPQVLLPGDLDAVGLANLLSSVSDVRASTLVFPHHGGQPAGDAFEFATHLCEAVQPSSVIFSIGRGRHGTPRPEVIAGIRASLPGAYIACTQLSDRCAASLPSVLGTHLGSSTARGMLTNACCAGTIHITLDEGYITEPDSAAHTTFIRREAPTALCQ